MFPEGTYFRDRMGPGRIGLIRMIMSHSDVPFIPTGIRYKASGFYTEVKIEFGNPINMGSSANPPLVVERIMKEIARLSGFQFDEGMVLSI